MELIDKQFFKKGLLFYFPITDSRNFLPWAIAVNRTESCIARGLSFFETGEAAENRLKSITKNKENL